MSNEIAQRPKFSALITTAGYQKMINNTLQDPERAKRFVASITSAVAANPALQECEAPSILSGALLGESLNLSPSPQLGQYYLVPFKNSKKNCMEASFILGYRGMIQLALRSGQYKRLNVMALKAGELVKFDPLTEEIEVNLIEDEAEREKMPSTGYVATFEYLNGFRKTIYWSKEKVMRHADKYSQAFSAEATTVNGKGGRVYNKVSFEDYQAGNYPKSDEWLYSSHWYKDFDGMAFKTLLRQLITKWGIMSIDMQKAFEEDKMEADHEYVEAVDTNTEPTKEIEVDAVPPQVSLDDV